MADKALIPPTDVMWGFCTVVNLKFQFLVELFLNCFLKSIFTKIDFTILEMVFRNRFLTKLSEIDF